MSRTLSSVLARATPPTVFFITAAFQFVFLALMIRLGLVSLAMPTDKLAAAELVAVLALLPIFAALGFGARPAVARTAISFCSGLLLAGADLALLVSIRPAIF